MRDRDIDLVRARDIDLVRATDIDLVRGRDINLVRGRDIDLVRARDIGSVTFTLTLALALALALSLTLGARPSLGGCGAQCPVPTLGPRLARARVTLRSRVRRRGRVTLTMARVRVTLSMAKVRVTLSMVRVRVMVRVRGTRHGVARGTQRGDRCCGGGEGVDAPVYAR